LAKHSILVVPHPLYSPHLPPLRLIPLPQAEEHLERETISRRRGDKLNTTRQLQAIPKQAYQTCIEKWKDRWNRCVQSAGSYFEGDNFEQLVDAFVFLQ
jgi:hypothetical protein